MVQWFQSKTQNPNPVNKIVYVEHETFPGALTIFLPLAALMCVVKVEGVPQLCKTDEIGELCVCTVATGSSYYGLAGMTKNTFEVRESLLS